MARALGELLSGLTQGLDVDALHHIQDGIGRALVQLNVLGAEAERERSARLAVGPDTGPLLRTLLRLRHDLVMIGRVAISPLPEAFGMRLESPLAHAGVAFADYLRATGAALQAQHGQLPPRDDRRDHWLRLRVRLRLRRDPDLLYGEFPDRYRASGANAGYQIAQVYGGGLIPILAGLILQAYGIHKAYIYIGLLVMVYAVLAILAIIATLETKNVNLEG